MKPPYWDNIILFLKKPKKNEENEPPKINEPEKKEVDKNHLNQPEEEEVDPEATYIPKKKHK